MHIFRMDGPIYDIFSSVRLVGQTNRHLYKITPYKNTASNLLDYIEKEALAVFILDDALSVWTNLGKTFVVRPDG